MFHLKSDILAPDELGPTASQGLSEPSQLHGHLCLLLLASHVAHRGASSASASRTYHDGAR